MLRAGRHTQFVVREAVDGVDAIEKANRNPIDNFGFSWAPRLKLSRSGHDPEGRYAGKPSHPHLCLPTCSLILSCEAIGVDFISKADGV
jgi:hypothetical protein